MAYPKMRWKFLSKLLPLVFISVGFNSNAQVVADGVVAVVGANIILKSEVESRHLDYVRQGFMDKTKEDLCEVFEEMLMDKLMLHRAEIDSVEVGEDEVESTIESRLQMLIQQMGSEERVEEYYDKTIPQIKEMIYPIVYESLVVQRMRQKINRNVEVTPSEVQIFFQNLPVDSIPVINAQVELSQLVIFPEIDKEAKEEAIEKLKGLKKRIEGGSSFSSLAVLYSEDPGSAKSGGEYKGIKRGQFVKEFEAVAFNLRKGEISDPFLTEFGYHIVQLMQRRGEELDVRHILVRPKISDENLETTKKRLDSIRDLIAEGFITFEQAVERFSMDEQTKFNRGLMMNPQTGEARFEAGELQRDIFVTVERLNEGEISKATFFRKQDGKEGFRIVKLHRKIEPHRANLREDYQFIKSMAMQKKSKERMRNWVERYISSTYININRNVFDCRSFSNNWIKIENTSN
ncbi:MAG: peptidylprolyl isomerase [Cryomorphaceae bacterium]|nr:peptidylprolyl isomerase [Cryomorphaceae bacterium]